MDSRQTGIEQVLRDQDRPISWLARKSGVSVSYAWKMIRGLRPMTPAFRAAAAEALGVPEDILFPAEPEQAAS